MLLESVSASAEVLSLLLEIGKAVRAGVGTRFSKEGFRVMSSLTTLEFRYDAAGHQTAYYVQDRRILFTRDGAISPLFQFATDGTDFVDEMLIDDKLIDFKKHSPMPEYGPAETLHYAKGQEVSATLIAHSVDGYRGTTETQRQNVVRWVGTNRLNIIFPADKKPTDCRLYYKDSSDQFDGQRHTGYRCDAKKTTCDRWMIVWEANNLKPGRIYSLEWRWTP